MNILRSLILALAAGPLTGCAYLTTFTSSVPVTDKTVALDMKTRIVFEKNNVVCAEPSPDALAVISASASLSAQVSDPTGEKAANAALGLAESGSFVGMRTPSIQLLRDAMYRLCEGAAGGLIDKDEFRSMQRRYQTTMLALLAIEQLTRPVAAGQVLLTGQAGGTAGAGDAAVEKAEQQLKTATDQRLSLQAESETAVRERDETHAQVIAKKRSRPDGKKDEALEVEIQTLDKQLAEKNDAVKDKQRRLEQTRSDESKARLAVLAAQSRASTLAAGQGSIGGGGWMAYAQATAAVAKVVEEVVDEAYETFSDEACLDFIKFAINPYESGARDAQGQPTVTRLPSTRFKALLDEKKQEPGAPTTAADAATQIMTTCTNRMEKGRNKPKRSASDEPKRTDAERVTATVSELITLRAALDTLNRPTEVPAPSATTAVAAGKPAKP